VRASRWGLQTSPSSGVRSSSLGSRTLLGVRECSRTHLDLVAAV
jgi:hypothetical protein